MRCTPDVDWHGSASNDWLMGQGSTGNYGGWEFYTKTGGGNANQGGQAITTTNSDQVVLEDANYVPGSGGSPSMGGGKLKWKTPLKWGRFEFKQATIPSGVNPAKALRKFEPAMGRQTKSTVKEDNKKQNEQIHTSRRLIIIVNGKEKIVTSYYTNGKLTGSSQYDTETKKYDD